MQRPQAEALMTWLPKLLPVAGCSLAQRTAADFDMIDYAALFNPVNRIAVAAPVGSTILAACSVNRMIRYKSLIR